MKGDRYITIGFDLGKIVVFEGDNGKVRGVAFDLEERFEDRPSNSGTARSFAHFLRGETKVLGFDVDLEDESPFRVRVYHRVMEIPYGHTATYGEVAADVGRPGGARAVGQAMAANRYPLVIPCHRVISGNGQLGGFSSGIELKRYLLKLEGHDF